MQMTEVQVFIFKALQNLDPMGASIMHEEIIHTLSPRLPCVLYLMLLYQIFKSSPGEWYSGSTRTSLTKTPPVPGIQSTGK